MGFVGKIGVVDSGVGGLFTLFNLHRAYPNVDFIYLADTKNLPYGNKSEGELVLIWENIAEFFSRMKVDAVVVACNTLSAMLLGIMPDILQPAYTQINVISPAIKSLDLNHRNVGVIATEYTVRSGVYHSKILSFKKQPFVVSCPELVDLIESGASKKTLSSALFGYLSQFEHKLDALILGCTHYSLLSDTIFEFFKRKVEIIDTNATVVDALGCVIETNAKSCGLGQMEFFTTGEADKFFNIAQLTVGNVFANETIKKTSQIQLV